MYNNKYTMASLQECLSMHTASPLPIMFTLPGARLKKSGARPYFWVKDSFRVAYLMQQHKLHQIDQLTY